MTSTQSEIFQAKTLSGLVAVVTGGGTGLGKASARELIACGAKVVVAGRREDILTSAAAELGESCSWVTGDIRETSGAQAIIDAALERHGRVDLLVNNAGGQYFVPAEAIELKGWRAVMRLNVGGTLRMCETAHERAFKPQKSGRIINVTLSPHNGLPGMTHSSAARAAVEALTLELSKRWTADGVTCAAIAAGHFRTEVLSKYPEQVWKSLQRAVPLGRLGQPEEHAWLVAMLASEIGDSFNGTTVTLDGARDNWFGPWPPPVLIDDEGEVPTEERKPTPSR